MYIVGWSDTIVIAAFLQALGKEHPEEGLIIHTDKGSQFTGSRFQEVLRNKGAVSSIVAKAIRMTML